MANDEGDARGLGGSKCRRRRRKTKETYRLPCNTEWLKTTPTPAKSSTPATTSESSILSHPSDLDWDKGIWAPVIRIGFPIFVNRNERIDDVYAYESVLTSRCRSLGMGTTSYDHHIWPRTTWLTKVSVPDRMMNPSYDSQFSSTSLAMSFHSAYQLLPRQRQYVGKA